MPGPPVNNEATSFVKEAGMVVVNHTCSSRCAVLSWRLSVLSRRPRILPRTKPWLPTPDGGDPDGVGRHSAEPGCRERPVGFSQEEWVHRDVKRKLTMANAAVVAMGRPTG